MHKFNKLDWLLVVMSCHTHRCPTHTDVPHTQMSHTHRCYTHTDVTHTQMSQAQMQTGVVMPHTQMQTGIVMSQAGVGSC